MDNIKYTRTTITVPEDVLFEIKKKALLEKKTAKEIINESLLSFLVSPIKTEDITSLFGAWGKGESGIKYVNKLREAKIEKKRSKYLKALWKKS